MVQKRQFVNKVQDHIAVDLYLQDTGKWLYLGYWL